MDSRLIGLTLSYTRKQKIHHRNISNIATLRCGTWPVAGSFSLYPPSRKVKMTNSLIKKSHCVWGFFLFFSFISLLRLVVALDNFQYLIAPRCLFASCCLAHRCYRRHDRLILFGNLIIWHRCWQSFGLFGLVRCCQVDADRVEAWALMWEKRSDELARSS